MSEPRQVPVELRVNGQATQASVEPRRLLVHHLRETLGLTGTHVGCDTTQCGACTVLLDGAAVKSCTVLAVQAHGCEVTTVEGLADGKQLHPVQDAFRTCHALQCGYCTPGFIMAAVQLVRRYPDPSDEQIREQLDGNICRCTGYRGIVQAVRMAAQAMREPKPASGG